MSKRVSMDTADISELSKLLENTKSSEFSLDDILNDAKNDKNNMTPNTVIKEVIKDKISQKSQSEENKQNRQNSRNITNSQNSQNSQKLQKPQKRTQNTMRNSKMFKTGKIGDIRARELYETDFLEEYDTDTKNPKILSAVAKQNAVFLSKRKPILIILAIISTYISLSGMFTLPLPLSISYIHSPYIHLLILATIHIIVMIIFSDIICDGLSKIFKPDCTTIIAIGLFASLVHISSIILIPKFGGYLSYSFINIIGLLIIVHSKIAEQKMMARAYKTANIATNITGICCDDNLIFKKDDVDVDDFIKNIKIQDNIFIKIYCSIIIAVCVLLTIVSVYIKADISFAIIMFSSLITAALPFSMISAISSPSKHTSKKLFTLGATTNFNTAKIAKTNNLIVKDSDLFGTNSISIKALQIIGEYPSSQVIAYTEALYNAANTSTSKIFAKLLRERYIKPMQCRNITHYKGGGFGGEIENDTVLIGTAPFIMRMGIKISEGRDIKNGVFVVINNKLSGVFALAYTSNSPSYIALHNLKRSNVNLIFATTDFNINPNLLEKVFDLKRGSVDFPDIEKRTELASLEKGDLSAILSRDSTGTFLNVIKSLKRMHTAININLITSIFSGLLGIAIMFYLLFTNAYITSNPYNTISYLLVWTLPVLLCSSYCKK